MIGTTNVAPTRTVARSVPGHSLSLHHVDPFFVLYGHHARKTGYRGLIFPSNTYRGIEAKNGHKKFSKVGPVEVASFGERYNHMVTMWLRESLLRIVVAAISQLGVKKGGTENAGSRGRSGREESSHVLQRN